MKTTFTTQHNAASTLNGSHAAHNVYSPLRRLTLLVTLLMTFALGARAAEYVFYNANYGYYLALNGTNLERTNTFNPSTCVWTGPDGNSGTFSIKSGNSTYYLRYSDGLTTTKNNNNATAWTIGNNKVYYQDGRNNYYIRYSNSNRAFQARTYDSENEILYKCVLESVAASSGEKSYTVSLTSVTANPAVLDYNSSTTVTASGGSVTITTTNTLAHTKYTLTPNGGGTAIAYYSQDGSTVSTTRPVSQTTSTPEVTGYEWAISPSNYTTLGNATTTTNTNTVTYSTASGTNTTVTLSATAYYTEGGQTYKSTAVNTTLTLNEKKDNPKGISAQPLTLAVDEQKSISYTLTPGNAHDNIAYSGYDGSIISIIDGVVKGLKAGITEVTLTAKNLDGTTSAHSATSTVTVTPKAPTIEFSLGSGIIAKITNPGANGTIYYTTNGDTPTASSTPYTDPFTVEAGVTVKAIVLVTVNDVQLVSPVTESLANAGSGSDGNTVFLYDLEDHSWTYYSGVNTSVDGGNYNTNYAGKLYSPNPRNVKITYNANGGAVSIDESETSFVYFKTLEQGATAQYPYTVISNPFSKRPTGMGFGGWKIISGHQYIRRANGNMAAENATLNLDEEITFVNLPYTSTNCISAEIKFEATWVDLNNIVRRTNTGDYTYSATGGTYETNILVLKSNHTGTITVNSPCTIMMVEPDGSDDFRNSYTFTGNITPNNSGVTKIEFTKWNSTQTLNCNNHNVTVGRGMTTTSQCASYVTGVTGKTENRNLTTYNSNLNYHLKLESGIFTDVSFIAGTEDTNGYVNCNGTSNQVKGTLGNDYDRAKGDNTQLLVKDELFLGYRPTYANGNQINATFTCWVKSGNLCSDTKVVNTTFNNSAPNGGYYGAAGQVFYVSSAGTQTNIGKRKLYVEGGVLAGIAGGIDTNNPQDNESFYLRMTGGQVRGVIYGSGAFAATSGIRRMIITGGTINGWVAAGCNGTDPDQEGGILPSDTYVYVGGTSHIGNTTDLTLNTSSDGNVFGAGSGNSAQATTGQVNNSHVIIADDCYIKNNVFGGGNYGYSNATANVYVTGGEVSGAVFGGSNQKQGVNVNVRMTGGQISSGVYGGSNVKGTISQNVTMQINGGQVGTPSAPANIHGGGYGKDTKVNGNVTLTLGSNTTDPGVTVYGDVYGGSALGTVNDANSDKTEVTLNCGTINGSLYGGGLGDATNAATVNGKVTVTTNGGRVTGAVYGCNNVNGAPANTVTVNINNTATPLAGQEFALNAVYGGGNKANYTYDVGPVVNVYAGYVANVFGGGNEATVAKTDVNIFGGHLLGNVYGGGNKADITTGGTDVDVTGGRISNVFGGNNESGNITGEVHVDISDVTTLTAYGRTDIDYVYGGGNLAAYTATGTKNFPIVNMISGQVRYALYGGGLGGSAVVRGNPQVTMTGGTVGYTETVDGKQVVSGGDVFGGGNAAEVIGNTSVVITGGEVKHNVYGGGNQAKVTGKTNVVIGQ